MGLTLYYLVASFQSELPWSYCRDEWQGECVDAISRDDNVDESNDLLRTDNSTLRSSAELYFRFAALFSKYIIQGRSPHFTI